MKMKKAVSIVIITALALIIGINCSFRIWKSTRADYEMYDTALQIQSEKEFSDAIENYNGYAFAYGVLKAEDPVSTPAVEGEYSFIQIETQEHESHLSYMLTYDSTTQSPKYTYYYTYNWEVIETEELHSNKFNFLGIEFDYETVDFPEAYELVTLKADDGDIRKVYTVCDSEYIGTVFIQITNGTVNSMKFYENTSIEQTIESLEGSNGIPAYIVVWFSIILVTWLAIVVIKDVFKY